MKLKEYRDIDEKLFAQTLPNGLKVFISPKPGFSKCHAFFATQYGGADRRFMLDNKWIDTPEGVAHFLEHKMFDTENGNALTLLTENGASANAYTSTDITAYHFESTENFEENLELLLSFVSVPYFTPESVEKERGIITQEILMSEDDPDYCLYYGLMRSLFQHNPLRDSVAGTIESIKSITASTLYDCHKTFYSPSNMALCVVGDVEPHSIVELASRVISSIDYKSIPERDYGEKENLAPLTMRFSRKMEVSLPIFLAGCKFETAQRGDACLKDELLSIFALDLLAGHSSPLYFRLYDDGIINTDFSVSFDSAFGMSYCMFGGEARDPQRVFDEIVKEIKTLTTSGLDSALFKRIKKAAVGSHIRSFNSFGAIASGAVTGHFKDFDIFESPTIMDSFTEDDVTQFLHECLIPENLAISIIEP